MPRTYFVSPTSTETATYSASQGPWVNPFAGAPQTISRIVAQGGGGSGGDGLAIGLGDPDFAGDGGGGGGGGGCVVIFNYTLSRPASDYAVNVGLGGVGGNGGASNFMITPGGFEEIILEGQGGAVGGYGGDFGIGGGGGSGESGQPGSLVFSGGSGGDGLFQQPGASGGGGGGGGGTLGSGSDGGDGGDFTSGARGLGGPGDPAGGLGGRGGVTDNPVGAGQVPGAGGGGGAAWNTSAGGAAPGLGGVGMRGQVTMSVDTIQACNPFAFTGDNKNLVLEAVGEANVGAYAVVVPDLLTRAIQIRQLNVQTDGQHRMMIVMRSPSAAESMLESWDEQDHTFNGGNPFVLPVGHTLLIKPAVGSSPGAVSGFVDWDKPTYL